jgi:hypothetical protein
VAQIAPEVKMKKLSGLVLDRYDDVDRSIRSDYTDELEKTARRYTYEELAVLPDETFAVILHDGDTFLKKFSMADAGNLALSIEYFKATGYKLPAEAQKVAAANLLKGCAWYGWALEPDLDEELQKVAFGVGTLTAALEAPGAIRESKNQLAASRPAGGAIMTPAQIKAQRMKMGV